MNINPEIKVFFQLLFLLIIFGVVTSKLEVKAQTCSGVVQCLYKHCSGFNCSSHTCGPDGASGGGQCGVQSSSLACFNRETALIGTCQFQECSSGGCNWDPGSATPTPTPTACTCDSWVPILSCGDTCQPNERRYTRNCSPSGCALSNSCFPAAECGGTATPTPPPPGSNVGGYHDAWSGNVAASSGQCAASGWAADPDNTNQDVNIRVLSDGNLVPGTSGLASNFRPDLGGVCSGATCGYTVNLFGSISQGVNHTISVQAQDLQTGSWVNLNNTNKTLNCCGPVSAPTVTAPAAPLACGTASTNVTWSAMPNASVYALRIDDTSNPWSGTCASVNSGDTCIDNIVGTSYSKSLVAGHTYNVWVHAINSCGEWSSSSAVSSFTVAANLNLSGSSSITIGSPQGFSASINPNTIALSRVDFSGTNGTGTISVNPASDSSSTYNTVISGLTPGTATVNATAYTASGALCSSSVPVTVTASTSPWWQVRGGDVTVGGSLTSQIPATCIGACTPTFNLRSASSTTGSLNNFNGTADFSAAAGNGVGAQPVDWKVNSSTLLSQTYNYNYFRNSVPSSWETRVINIAGATLDPNNIPTMGTPVPGVGYYILYKNGDLTLTGDLNNSNLKIILFVENGDLTLGNAAASRLTVNDGSGFFMAVVGKGTISTKGNIIVSPSVVSANTGDFRYEGMFLAEGQFRTSGTNQLALRGSYAALGGFDLRRDLANDSTTPAEYFEFSPQLLMTYPQSLSNKRIRWQEVNP